LILISDILQIAGKKFVDRIQNEFDKKGLNDTGKAKDSLGFTAKGTSLSIEGKLRIIFLQDGRKPGKFPPIDVIRGWVERKLGVPSEKSRNVAFLIARKIAEKGTDIFTDKAKGLQLELILNEMQTILLDEIANEVFLQVNNSVFQSIKS